jgi:hypothetical protein
MLFYPLLWSVVLEIDVCFIVAQLHWILSEYSKQLSIYLIFISIFQWNLPTSWNVRTHNALKVSLGWGGKVYVLIIFGRKTVFSLHFIDPRMLGLRKWLQFLCQENTFRDLAKDFFRNTAGCIYESFGPIITLMSFTRFFFHH